MNERTNERTNETVMSACEVDDCPALVMGLTRKCDVHQKAQLAKAAHCVKKRCESCRRVIREMDWVFREMVPVFNRRKPGEAYGWRHVACEPPSPRVSRRVVKESEKPLLSEL